jgi:hypothetical protein
MAGDQCFQEGNNRILFTVSELKISQFIGIDIEGYLRRGPAGFSLDLPVSTPADAQNVPGIVEMDDLF